MFAVSPRPRMLVDDDTCCIRVGCVGGGGLVAQETATLVTLALPTVPEPPETVQVCPDGWEKTVTD